MLFIHAALYIEHTKLEADIHKISPTKKVKVKVRMYFFLFCLPYKCEFPLLSAQCTVGDLLFEHGLAHVGVVYGQASRGKFKGIMCSWPVMELSVGERV